MSRRRKLVNNTGIPQYVIESIAQCLLPDIIACYETEEGQRQFREWKAMQEVEALEGEKLKNSKTIEE